MSECLFAPGVAYRFQGGEGSLDLLICFKCTDWRFYGPDGELNESFSAVEGEAIEVVQELFPDDEVIQSLKPTIE